jgi:uncharacterized membrane protein YagU involved in acid resistance
MATITGNQAGTADSALTTGITHGVVAGLIGGSVFGVMMASMGMLPMVAQMIGAENPMIGFVLHLLISAVIGGTYGVIAPRLPAGWPVVVAAGIVYGIIWWVLGALIIMPLVLGMGEMVLQVGEMQWMSLVGHIAFGVVTAVLYTLIAQQQHTATA